MQAVSLRRRSAQIESARPAPNRDLAAFARRLGRGSRRFERNELLLPLVPELVGAHRGPAQVLRGTRARVDAARRCPELARGQRRYNRRSGSRTRCRRRSLREPCGVDRGLHDRGRGAGAARQAPAVQALRRRTKTASSHPVGRGPLLSSTGEGLGGHRRQGRVRFGTRSRMADRRTLCQVVACLG